MKNVFESIFKILGFLLALPLIIASVIAFQTQILSLPVAREVWVLWGGGLYVALNLFIYDFKDVYVFGKEQVDKIFASFKPAGYVIPVYAVLLIFIYEILMLLGHGRFQPYFLLAIAFAMVMHLVQTAHDIYASDSSILKAHYLLSFGAILVVNLILISLLWAWVIPEYSFVGFIKSLSAQTCHLYQFIYKALFIDSSV